MCQLVKVYATGTRDYTPLIAVHDALLFREKVGAVQVESS
jgi:hypothetical protein